MKSKLPRIIGFNGRSPEKAALLPPDISSAQGSRSTGEQSVTIAIYSVKGGVGKTTFAANLAWCSAVTHGRKTLLWDLDAAGGSAFLYGLEANGRRAAEDVFTRDRTPSELIQATDFAGLELLPADESIRALDAQLVRIGKRRRLPKLVQELSANYERILLDCPPVMNELSAQVVRAADLVIVPLPPSPLSSRALDLVVREIAQSSKRHPPILPVLSMVDPRRALHRQACEANPTWPIIPYASAVEQCAVRQRPVGALAPRSSAAEAFARLYRAIEAKLEQRAVSQ